jgi:hypothetical protein
VRRCRIEKGLSDKVIRPDGSGVLRLGGRAGRDKIGSGDGLARFKTR